MKQNKWKIIEDIFHKAVTLPPDEREKFVAEKCGEDDELCREILALLFEDSENSDFLSEPLFNEGLLLLKNDFSGLLEQDEFSHYKLKKLLGRGGMGAVFLALDISLERDVALKILPPEFAENPESVLRFRQEARAASAISHQNIAHIYEFGEANGRYFLAMEFVEGKTLRELLKEKSIDVPRALEIARQIADALAVMHRRGIIHRDIKPENIIINESKLVKILDFGLAKLNSAHETENSAFASLETIPGIIIGTTAYMSPEQVRGQTLDGRSDLWSLGVLLFEMLAAVRPFTGETSSDVQAAILLKDVSLVELPSQTAVIVSKLLKKDSNERYQTAEEFLRDLKQTKQELLNRDVSHKKSASKIDLINDSTIFPTNNTKKFLGGNGKFKSLFITVIFVLLAAIGFKYWVAEHQPADSIATADQRNIKTIAVLPFINESGNEEDEFLSDGLTESLIYQLSQLPEITVKARNSSFYYKGKDFDPKAAGVNLSVQAIIVGRVSESDGKLSVAAQLIDVETGSSIWSKRYTRNLSNFSELKDEILLDVSHQLKPQLSGTNERKLTKKFTNNSDAYNFYLKGRFYWNKRTTKGLQKSIEYFDEAIRLDPNFALAYAGLADSYVLLSGYGVSSPQESFPKAEQAALKALEIDDTLAEAHTTLGYIYFNYSWEFEKSEKEMQRALELNPNYATAYHWYGNANLLAAGKFDEAIAATKKAQELDPLSLIINADLATAYLYADNIDKAIEQYRKTIELDENFYYAHVHLGRSYMMKGDYQNAFAELKKAQTLSDDPRTLMLFACAYSRMNNRGEALKILDKLNRTARKRFVSPYYFALVYTALGDKDKAFEWLETAFQQREGRLISIKVDPLLRELHSDARFQNLVKRIGH